MTSIKFKYLFYQDDNDEINEKILLWKFNELNIQPCSINVFPLVTDYEKLSGTIVDKKYSKNCIIPHSKYLY